MRKTGLIHVGTGYRSDKVFSKIEALSEEKYKEEVHSIILKLFQEDKPLKIIKDHNPIYHLRMLQQIGESNATIPNSSL